jgi:hypothetical protein
MPPIAFSSSIASAMEMLGLRLRAVSTSSRPQSSSSARSCSSWAESFGESSGMLGFVPVCVMGPHHRDELAPSHVWMAPAWQEIIWRAAQRSLAVMCPACWCSPGGLLALMGSANRVLIIRTGSMSR